MKTSGKWHRHVRCFALGIVAAAVCGEGGADVMPLPKTEHNLASFGDEGLDADTAVGPFGGKNLIVNPEFEQASVAANSNSGNWGYFKNKLVSAEGWTGGGNAGISRPTRTTLWRPYLPQKDDYCAFLQMQNAKDDSAFIEQTVTVATSGNYAFSCQYASRYNWDQAGEFGLRVTVDGVSTEYEAISFAKGVNAYQYTTWYLSLEAGKSYTFRLHGLAGPNTDHTVIIGSCALELLSAANRAIHANYHLTADEDWSGQVVDIDPGVKVFLDGHNLRIGAVRPTGRGAAPIITDETAVPGELHLVAAGGATKRNCGVSVAGAVKVVKDGEGMFVWNGGFIAESAPILITNGVFQMGCYLPDVFGAGGMVTVTGKGQFDIHHRDGSTGMYSPSYARAFRIAGDGPDGKGAIVNSIPDTTLSLSAGGRHLGSVVLMDDATIGGTSRIDFRGKGPGVDATGFTLTIKNTEMVAFCGGTAYLRADKLVLADGGVFQPCNGGCEIAIADDILLDGGIIATWAPAGDNSTLPLYTPVVVGESGGKIFSSWNWYNLLRPVTVQAGCTLEIGAACGWYSTITNSVGSTLIVTNDDCCVRIAEKFVNAGIVEHGAGEFRFGSESDAAVSCVVENDGVIRSCGGDFYLNAASTMSGAGLLEITGGMAEIAGNAERFVGTVRLAGGTTDFGSVGRFTGTLVLAGGKVTSSLAGASCPVVFDLAAMDEPVSLDNSGWSTLPAATPVTVNLDGRELHPGDKLLSWAQVPQLVFAMDDATAAKGQSLVSTSAGLYYGADPESRDAAYATWTGAAGNGKYSDAGNWVCTNAANRVIADGVPNRETFITLAADVIGDGWRELPFNAQAGLIDLKGHTAYLYGMDGENTTSFIITDTSTDAARPGEVHFRIGAGTNFTKNADIAISGNLKLVVDGEGQFVWGGGTLDASIPIVVSNGYFKVGVDTANVFGTGGTVTVADHGQFNISYGVVYGKSPVYARTFYIEGEGPDGNGALVNSGNGGEAGSHLSHVVMTGNATIGGTSRIDFRGKGPGIDGAGLTLTIKNTAMVAFCGGTAYLNASNVVVRDNGVLQPCSNGCVINIEDSLMLENGGVLAGWANKNETYTFAFPVLVGEGGGQIRSDYNSLSVSKPVTVLAGGQLSFGANGAPWYSSFETKVGGTILVNAGSQFVSAGYLNNGAFVQTGGNFQINSKLTNNGTMKTSGGTFILAAEQQVEGTGLLELAGGEPKVAAALGDYTGEILLSGGSATISQIDTFPGTLRLRDGEMVSSLAGFPGRVVIDLVGRELPYSVEGKNWLTFSAGKCVDVEVGDRKFKTGDQIVSWVTPPANLGKVRFRFANGQTGLIEVRPNGLFYARGMTIFIR